MLSLELVDVLLRSVPARRSNVAVFLGLDLGLAGCGRSSLSIATAVFADGRKQLINMFAWSVV